MKAKAFIYNCHQAERKFAIKFWEQKLLTELDAEEWEQLCDGCGRCCMLKLEDEDTEDVAYTGMVCGLLDLETINCTQYPQRHELVPDCVVFDAAGAESFGWLPKSCAYRRLAEGRSLAWWHPLISGTRQTVVDAGISVHGRVVSEDNVHPDEHESMVVTWVEY